MTDQLSYGSFYFSTPAETSLSASPIAPAKAAGTTTEFVSNGMTVSNSNRITLDAGQTTRDYEVVASISATKAGGGATLGTFYIAKNGTVVPGAMTNRQLANTSDEGAVPITCQLTLEAGDYLEIFVGSANNDNLTVESGGMSVKVIG